jgi:N6-L-threonylcarbamoyladenine synthase/protein kinase Bud32
VRDVDDDEGTPVFERVGTADLAHALTDPRVRAVGRHLAAIHDAGFVHGDPTTRNVRVTPQHAGSDGESGSGERERVYLIDFGLGYHSDHVEDYAMDLHVFYQSLVGTASDPEPLRAAVREGYRDAGEDRVLDERRVLDQLRAIEGRGRYQSEPE